MRNLLRKTFIWIWLRRRGILKRHRCVTTFWLSLIEKYYNNELSITKITKKQNLNNSKIIWQYWGQGFNSLPDIVKICFASVDKYRGDYEVIRLSDDTISDYIEFPEEVLRKLREKVFTRTAFSDLLRLALLNAYGGVWLDATVLLTNKLPAQFAVMDYFLYQRSHEVKDKSFWENIYSYYWGWYKGFKVNMLSSIMFSHKNNKIISDSSNLLLYVWENEEQYPDYFAFQILYDCLISNRMRNNKCPIISDTIPHLLQMKLNNHTIDYSFVEILNITSLHKMCYYDEKTMVRVKDFVKKYLDIKID